MNLQPVPPCEAETVDELVDRLRDDNLYLRLAVSTALGILRRALEIDSGAEDRARDQIGFAEGGYAAAFGHMIASRDYLRDCALLAVDRLVHGATEVSR